LHNAKPGDHVQLTVLRGNQTLQISVTVADRPAT
jgi:S1-C subfamily serine protease